MAAIKSKRVTKDAKIDVRVTKTTRKQADKLAAKHELSLSTYLQLLIQDQYNKEFSA